MSEDSLIRSQRSLGIDPKELEKARSLLTEKREIPLVSLPPESDPSPPSVDFRDLRTTGQIASQFNQGLDKVTDVLLLLVLKFGRASSLLVGVLVGIAICIIALVWNTAYLAATRSDVADAQAQQEEILRKQEEILKQTQEAYNSVMDAKKVAEEAAEAAPAVVVDEDGRAKLIIKGDKENPLPNELPNSKRPSAAKRTDKGVEIPLNF